MSPLRVLQIALVISFYLQYFTTTTALQCYYCENCKDSDELTELHICGELAPLDPWEPIARTTTFIAMSTLAINNEVTTTTTEISPATSSTTSDTTRATNQEETTIITTTTTTTTVTPPLTTQIPSSPNTEPTTTTTSTTTTTTTTTEDEPIIETIEVQEEYPSTISSSESTTTTATTTSTDASDFDEDYLDYGDDGEITRRHFQNRQIMSRPTCYMLTAIVNGSVVINRGCANMVNDNKQETCSAIYGQAEGDLVECQLCNTNACNRFATTGAANAMSTNMTFWQALSKFFLVILINLF